MFSQPDALRFLPDRFSLTFFDFPLSRSSVAWYSETGAQSASLNGCWAMFDFQAADQGEYQCLAESEAGTAERTITLKVQGEFTFLYA